VLNLRATSSLAQFPPDPDVFQLLADQVASAIETSRLFSERGPRSSNCRPSPTARPSPSGSKARDPSGGLEFTPTGVAARPPASISAMYEVSACRSCSRAAGLHAACDAGERGLTELDETLRTKRLHRWRWRWRMRVCLRNQERALQEQRLSEFSLASTSQWTWIPCCRPRSRVGDASGVSESSYTYASAPR